jgi:hypothetical protein
MALLPDSSSLPDHIGLSRLIRLGFLKNGEGEPANLPKEFKEIGMMTKRQSMACILPYRSARLARRLVNYWTLTAGRMLSCMIAGGLPSRLVNTAPIARTPRLAAVP